MTYWYEDEKNIVELAEFLVQSKEISTTDELLDFFKYPEKYTDVWNIYEEQILGREPVRLGFSKNEKLNGHKRPQMTKGHIVCACESKQ